MSEYHCSVCGRPAYFDGRCGDGSVLVCGCDNGEWIDDGRGGYQTNPTGARPVPGPGRATQTDRIESLLRQLADARKTKE